MSDEETRQLEVGDVLYCEVRFYSSLRRYTITRVTKTIAFSRNVKFRRTLGDDGAVSIPHTYTRYWMATKELDDRCETECLIEKMNQTDFSRLPLATLNQIDNILEEEKLNQGEYDGH